MKAMQLKPLTAACALALAGVSGQALALGPGVTPDVQLFISGSSAQQKSLGALFGSFCKSGTLDTYFDNGGGKQFRAYFCTFDGANPRVPASLAGKNVLIHNRAKGGSAFGVLPVARAQAIDSMQVSAANCTSTGAATWSCDISAGKLVPRVPDGGVSDVEPAMFVPPNVPPGGTAVTGADLANLTVGSELAVVFGVVVSNNTPVSNLSRSQVASIFSGTYRDWHQVDPAIPAGTPIQVCRRVPGSGTQAGAQAFFLNSPCSKTGAVDFVTSALSDPVSGYTVSELPSTGDLLTCVNNAAAAGKMAIGISGIEKQPGPTDAYKYVSIDGIAPTVQDAATGKYDYWFEQAIQWRSTTVGGIPAPSGAQLDLLNLIKSASGDPAVITSAGIDGVAALPTNGFAPTIPFTATNPVMQGSRFSNSCQAPRLFF